MNIAGLCAAHQRIALDSHVFIYLAEQDPMHVRRAAGVIDAVADGAVEGSLSVVGVAEVLLGPAMRGEFIAVEQMAAEIDSTPNLKVVAVTPEIAIDAAVIGGLRRLKLADAIHLASARAVGATAFVTNDRRLRSAAHLQVVYLDDLELDGDPIAGSSGRGADLQP